MKARAGLALILAGLAGAALAQAQTQAPVKAGALTLETLAVRASLGSVPTSAAYLTIVNHGRSPDRLLSVDCACAAHAMMHRSETRNGVSTMAMVDTVEIPAGGRAAFTPQGLHIMLTGLKAPLKAGARQRLTLHFEKAGAVTADFPVLAVIPPR